MLQMFRYVMLSNWRNLSGKIAFQYHQVISSFTNIKFKFNKILLKNSKKKKDCALKYKMWSLENAAVSVERCEIRMRHTPLIQIKQQQYLPVSFFVVGFLYRCCCCSSKLRFVFVTMAYSGVISVRRAFYRG